MNQFNINPSKRKARSNLIGDMPLKEVCPLPALRAFQYFYNHPTLKILVSVIVSGVPMVLTKKRPHPFRDQAFLVFLLVAGLVADGQRGLTCRLAGSPALAAATVTHGALQRPPADGLYMFAQPCRLLNT